MASLPSSEIKKYNGSGDVLFNIFPSSQVPLLLVSTIARITYSPAVNLLKVNSEADVRELIATDDFKNAAFITGNQKLFDEAMDFHEYQSIV